MLIIYLKVTLGLCSNVENQTYYSDGECCNCKVQFRAQHTGKTTWLAAHLVSGEAVEAASHKEAHYSHGG